MWYILIHIGVHRDSLFLLLHTGYWLADYRLLPLTTPRGSYGVSMNAFGLPQTFSNFLAMKGSRFTRASRSAFVPK